MTAAVLDAIEALMKKATPGPWNFVPWHIEEGPPAVRSEQSYICSTGPEIDAKLIAALRNAAPALLASARREARLEALLRRVQAERDDGRLPHMRLQLADDIAKELT